MRSGSNCILQNFVPYLSLLHVFSSTKQVPWSDKSKSIQVFDTQDREGSRRGLFSSLTYRPDDELVNHVSKVNVTERDRLRISSGPISDGR